MHRTLCLILIQKMCVSKRIFVVWMMRKKSGHLDPFAHNLLCRIATTVLLPNAPPIDSTMLSNSSPRPWRLGGSIFFTLNLLIALGCPALVDAAPRFAISFDQKVRAEPYTGRVYLFFSKRGDPRNGPNWFTPEPFVAQDVKDWKPGESLTFDGMQADKLLAFPKPLADLDLKGHRVQAVARFNPHDRNVGTGPGNGYSAAAQLLDETDVMVTLSIDTLVAERPFPENQWCKLLDVRSGLLSTFHKRDVSLRGSVLLPASYEKEPERRYPVIFNVPGFGGTHMHGVRREPIAEDNAGGVEFIRVTLDPSCPLGHHVFADSANNGPVGQALITEFIPGLDRRYRTIAQPTARFLTGHSSGGWSTLWLQVTYPDTFGGTWSTAPDPVDFRDFQRIDMYRTGENMYRDDMRNRRPLARTGDTVRLWYDSFDHMETVLGYGGQLHSFEAVFSPRGPDGKPLLAWDRKTGAVNTQVAKSWEKYDIRLILETRWPELGPKLAGKLHVIMGEGDTFYLEGATRLLKESLTKLGSDAVVEMVPGKDHFNLLSPELLTRIRGEMTQSFLKHHPRP